MRRIRCPGALALLALCLAAPRLRGQAAAPPTAQRYVIYLHARIVEDRGRHPTDPVFGPYEYDAILDSLRGHGFTVLSLQRPAGASSDSFAVRTVAQVDSLLALGVPPGNITVMGFSKGGWIAVLASARLRRPDVAFVFMAACGPWTNDAPELRVSGRLLSLYETSDTLGVSCVPMLARSLPGSETRELSLSLGLGHGTFFRPRADWLEPALAWAEHREPVPAHDTLTIASRILGEARPVNVHLPPGYSGATRRYPVLYMPDGGVDEDFPHVVNTVDSLAALGKIRPVIIVGIPNTERRRDLTGPTRFAADSAVAPHVGGSAAFRRFIAAELMPVIDRRYRTTGERSIVGESLAGLFILETFLVEPGLFDHYVALDPSVWWNGNALVDSAAGRLAAMHPVPRSLYLATSNVPDITDGTARVAAMLRAHPPAGLDWVYVPRPDLTHGTIFRGVGPDALADALR